MEQITNSTFKLNQKPLRSPIAKPNCKAFLSNFDSTPYEVIVHSPTFHLSSSSFPFSFRPYQQQQETMNSNTSFNGATIQKQPLSNINKGPIVASAPVKQKRVQAHRACSNCKRLHAKCDNERPCRRCVQNGTTSTCFDVPRKRRVSNRAIVDVMRTLSVDPMNMYAPLGMHSDPYGYPYTNVGCNWVFGSTPNKGMDMLSRSHHHASPAPPIDDDLFITSIVSDEKPNDNSHSFHKEMTSSGNFFNNNHGNDSVTSDQLFVPESSSGNSFSFFGNAKMNGFDIGQQHQSTQPWTSFVQTELACSVWRQAIETQRTELVECNEKFVQLTGFSRDELKVQTPQTLFVSYDSSAPFPRKTQIATSDGNKEVWVTIYPSTVDAKYRQFIMNMVEVPPGMSSL